MRADLRDISSADTADLRSWQPESSSFCVTVRMMIGPKGDEGAESFDITICSPQWLHEFAERDGIVSGRHTLVMNVFNYDALEGYLTKRVQSIVGDTWDEVARKLSRLGYWEFEDYSP